MTHLDMSIDAARIKTLRDQRAWSQEQLAAVSGLSARTIQRLEAEGKASAESRMAVAAAFGLDPAQLLPGAATDAATTGNEVPGDVAGGRAGVTASIAGAGAAVGGAREDRLLKIALLVLLAILVVVWFGYTVGRDMARRDNARDAACATDDADCAANTRPATRQAP